MYNLPDFVRSGDEDWVNGKLLERTTCLGNRANILLFGNALITHALPRLSELSQDILGGYIASSQHRASHSKGCPVAPEPLAGRGDHVGVC